MYESRSQSILIERAPRRQRKRVAISVAGLQADVVRAAVGLAFAVEPGDLVAPTRSRADIAAARQAAMYLAHLVFGLSHSQVGRMFLRDRTTAAHACQVVEDRRDDPDYDARLQVIEAALGLLPHPAAPALPAPRAAGAAR